MEIKNTQQRKIKSRLRMVRRFQKKKLAQLRSKQEMSAKKIQNLRQTHSVRLNKVREQSGNSSFTGEKPYSDLGKVTPPMTKEALKQEETKDVAHSAEEDS
jgi:hypothetical protein